MPKYGNLFDVIFLLGKANKPLVFFQDEDPVSDRQHPSRSIAPILIIIECL